MKLSISPGNSKTGKIPSVSLPPGITCTNEARRSCFKRGCYAVKLARIYPNVKRAWDNNLELWRTDPADYESQLSKYLSRHHPSFFRWHVSGDIPNRRYWDMMLRLALAFPETRFLAFTKRIEYASYYGKLPPNLSLVYSCWPGNDIPANGIPLTFLTSDPALPADARPCPGNCETCGLCWSLRKGESVAFKKH